MDRYYRTVNIAWTVTLMSLPVAGFLGNEPGNKRNWILESPAYLVSFTAMMCVWGMTMLICRRRYMTDAHRRRLKIARRLPRPLRCLLIPNRRTWLYRSWSVVGPVLVIGCMVFILLFWLAISLKII